MEKSTIAWVVAAIVAVLIISGLATGAIQGWVRDIGDLATEAAKPTPPQQ